VGDAREHTHEHGVARALCVSEQRGEECKPTQLRARDDARHSTLAPLCETRRAFMQL
jgi:hypothetical protein